MSGYAGEEACEPTREVGGTKVPDYQLSLKNMCKAWLKKNFNINATITAIRIKKQSYLDRSLNIVPVGFDFTTTSDNEGDGVAFFDADKISLG